MPFVPCGFWLLAKKDLPTSSFLLQVKAIASETIPKLFSFVA